MLQLIGELRSSLSDCTAYEQQGTDASEIFFRCGVLGAYGMSLLTVWCKLSFVFVGSDSVTHVHHFSWSIKHYSSCLQPAHGVWTTAEHRTRQWLREE